MKRWVRHVPAAGFLCLGIAGLSGCGGDEVETYDVPKGSETIAETATEAPPPAMGQGQELPPGHPPIGDAPMAGESALPPGHPPVEGSTGSMQAAPSETPWTAPEGWEPLADVPPMRLATYIIEDPEGPVEVAISRFPGDVGGVLANINRWRGQVGLPPVGEGDLEELVARFEAPGFEGYEVHLRGPQLHMLASGIHDLAADHTWFVRVTTAEGPADRVQDEVFAFARSFMAMESDGGGADASSTY